jgi:tRNA nucleotidyltransferase/poly(A) polymerase
LLTEAIQSHAKEILSIAQERVGIEINKMWEQDKKKEVINDLKDLNLLEYLYPK